MERQSDQILLYGTLSFDTVPQIVKILNQPPCEAICIDLSQVTYADSSALALLIELKKSTKKNGVLAIKNIPENLRKLAVLSGVEAFLGLNT